MNENNDKRYYGKYRGIVFNNIDPLKEGRLQVQVSDVLGADSCIWATSASPLAGKQMGIYAVPSIGDGVWIEFEHGDPSFAVWTGSWRGSTAEVPAKALATSPATPPIIVQSTAQNKLIISSVPGEGMTLETSAGPLGPQIVIDATSIKLTCGAFTSIELTQSAVKINGETFVVKSLV